MYIEVLELKEKENGGADLVLDLDQEALQLLVSSAIRNALELLMKEEKLLPIK